LHAWLLFWFLGKHLPSALSIIDIALCNCLVNRLRLIHCRT
jgi:hypothetical protein